MVRLGNLTRAAHEPPLRTFVLFFNFSSIDRVLTSRGKCHTPFQQHGKTHRGDFDADAGDGSVGEALRGCAAP